MRFHFNNFINLLFLIHWGLGNGYFHLTSPRIANSFRNKLMNPISHDLDVICRLSVGKKIQRTSNRMTLHCDNNKLSPSNSSDDKKWNWNTFLRKISWSSLVGGSILGTLITTLAIFGPIFYETFEEYHSESNTASTSGSDNSKTIEQQISLFGNILYDLQIGYVDEINPTKLFESAVSGMLKTLDPYTEFENIKQAKSIQETVTGKYGGIGVVIGNSNTVIKDGKPAVNIDTKGVTIQDTFEGYGYDSGLRVGDRIIRVDGMDIRNMNIQQIRDLLRGEPESNVVIEVERDVYGSTFQNVREKENKVIKEYTLKRNLVNISDVRLATFIGEPKDGIGYINLSGFNSNAARDFRTAMLMLRFSGASDLKGLILDLRGNPGGLLDQAVEIASYLVPKDSNIVSSRGKDGVDIVYKSSVSPIRPKDMKLAVLVNGNSASASEIVAGAIQDLDAGIIVGSSKTFGKGLVQKIVPLPYDSALKYTIAKYYTPSGRCIQAVKYNGGRAKLPSTSLNPLKKDDVSNNIISDTSPIDEDSSLYDSSFDISSDGAEKISDKDRKIYYTKNNRPVKDGGGIEPDILLKEYKPGSAEVALSTQNIFSQFAQEFLLKNDIRPYLQKFADEEHLLRSLDPRASQILNVNSMFQYLVLQPFVDMNSKYINDSPLNHLKSSSDFWKYMSSYASKELAVNENILYQNFKEFVSTSIQQGKFSLSPFSISSQLKDLEMTLKNEGYENTSLDDDIKLLKSHVQDSVLKDMDLHKSDIIDEVELFLLSREFPDRLLFYRNIVRDPQVEETFKMFQRDDLFPVSAAEEDTPIAITNTGSSVNEKSML